MSSGCQGDELLRFYCISKVEIMFAFCGKADAADCLLTKWQAKLQQNST